MLYLARSLSRLHFSSLMAVYAESNRENGREFWPEEPESWRKKISTAI